VKADWVQIKTEYVVKGTPYRKLCEKYGVSLRTLADHATRENWTEERKKMRSAVAKEAQQIATKAGSVAASNRVERLYTASEQLMKKAEQLLYLDEPLSPRDLKALSATLLDARVLMGIRDDDDRAEQRVRIDKMRAELASIKTDETRTVEVVFETPVWEETP
jgi:hypothetical protein